MANRKKSALNSDIFDESVEIPEDNLLLEVPKSEIGLIEYLEDKYSIKKNPEESIYEKVTEKVRKNGGYCPCKIVKNNDTRCICKDFKLQDFEGLCKCKRYVKVLNDVEFFKKMRISSAKRRNH